MTLQNGAKLGPFEIQSPIGAGGMGEVYRAKDMRLNRTVAIKVLPSHLSADPDLRQRFEREADGQRFLVSSATAQSSPPINVILNWTELIREPR